MEGILLILICLILGQIFARNGAIPRQDFIGTLNLIAIQGALPAIIFYKLYSQPLSLDALFPLLMPWLLFLITIGIVQLIHLFWPMRRSLIGCLIILAGTGNTSFVGYPLITALMGGDHFLEYAIVYDQSNFMVLFTAGTLIADLYRGEKVDIRASFINFLKFRPIQALILAILLRPLPLPTLFLEALNLFGSILTPITMLSVGASLQRPKSSTLFKPLLLGLSIKLLILPALTLLGLLLFYASALPEVNQIIVMQSAMAPMVLAVIIAREKNLEPELATLLTAIGIPISFITVSFWYWLTLTL